MQYEDWVVKCGICIIKSCLKFFMVLTLKCAINYDALLVIQNDNAIKAQNKMKLKKKKKKKHSKDGKCLSCINLKTMYSVLTCNETNDEIRIIETIMYFNTITLRRHSVWQTLPTCLHDVFLYLCWTFILDSFRWLMVVSLLWKILCMSCLNLRQCFPIEFKSMSFCVLDLSRRTSSTQAISSGWTQGTVTALMSTPRTACGCPKTSLSTLTSWPSLSGHQALCTMNPAKTACTRWASTSSLVCSSAAADRLCRKLTGGSRRSLTAGSSMALLTMTRQCTWCFITRTPPCFT